MSIKDSLSFNPATFVPPKQPLASNPSAIIVGEQPGVQEIKNLEPFVGPAGRLLNEIANEVGIQRWYLYLTNVIKDLDCPLEKYFKLNKGKVSLSPRGREYIDLLNHEVYNHSTNIIVAVGNVALYALLGKTGITKWRGSKIPWQYNENKTVIPIIHPSTVLSPKFQYLNRHLIKFDLKKVKRLMTEGYQPTQRQIIIEPSFDDSINFLLDCKRQGERGFTIYYDLEVFNEEVSCISFSTDKHSAISIPFIGPDGDYFPPNQEAEIWKLIAEILENPRIRKGGQNISFDAHFLLRRYGIKPKFLDDTMVAEQIILPDYPKGLDFITSIWADHPYYKNEGKRWLKVGGAWRQLWHYNATDSIICAEAFPNQWESIINQGNAKTYERQRLLIEPLVFMQEHGIRVDVEGMKTLRDEYKQKITKMENELYKLAGRELNPRSPDQLKRYFYEEKGFPRYKDKGSVTTNDVAMKRMARKGSREAELVRGIRSYGKLISNYLNVDKIDSDGRMRTSYNPVGTRYSRISSSESIFGTGMNLQNIPHEMLRFFLPDENHVFYSFDLSQVENRIVAYVGKIHQMIDVFEANEDVHSLTGALISGKTLEEVKDEDDKDIKSILGDGSKTWRFWGKKTNHELNYGMSYKTFALQQEIPEKDGLFLYNAYHNAYPGLKNGYWSFVKKQLSKSRTLENLMGRKTIFLDGWGDDLLREAYSCIPQGTTGDKINEHGLLFIYYNQNKFRPIKLLNQVHDSTGFQIPLVVPWTEHARMLLEIKNELEKPLTTHYGNAFTVPADLIIGCTFSKKVHGEELKSTKIPSDPDQLANMLKDAYGRCYEKTYGAAYAEET